MSEKRIILVSSSRKELATLLRSDVIVSQCRDFSVGISSFVLTSRPTDKANGLINVDDFIDELHDVSFLYYSFFQKLDKKDFPFAIFCRTINEVADCFSSFSSLRLFANYEAENTIAAKTSTFFDFYGTKGYCGGAERYMVDLDKVVRKLPEGISLDIYQQSAYPFFRKFGDTNIIGVGNLVKDDKDGLDCWTVESVEHYWDRFVQYANPRAQAYIYSAFNECSSPSPGPSIGISHGVFWDNPWPNDLQKQKVLECARNCEKLISVDSNTCNWLQTFDYELAKDDCTFIPNYVDTVEFSPRPDYLSRGKSIRIVFPRRLYSPRGLDITLEILDPILERHQDVEFHFVGRGEEEDLAKAEEYVERYPGRVFRYEKMPEEMSDVYRSADISLIPTMYSEGTSLSCLEAMASGNLVIATRVGGLTDLILDGFNGLLVDPTSESLLSALEGAISNFDEMSQLRENAVSTARAFSKDKWESKWTRVLEELELKKGENCIPLELVEIALGGIDDIDIELFNLVKHELCDGALVYIKVPTLEESMALQAEYGGGLLQFVPETIQSVCSVDRDLSHG